MSALQTLVNKGHEIRQAKGGNYQMMSDAINLAESGDASILLDLILLENTTDAKAEVLKRFGNKQ